jgi:hypothetical protein
MDPVAWRWRMPEVEPVWSSETAALGRDQYGTVVVNDSGALLFHLERMASKVHYINHLSLK